MKLLALDSSTQYCSVALTVEGEVRQKIEQAQRQQARLVLPMVDGLLAEVGLSLKQLDGLAFSAGPGSFTGIRLAAGITQGLAYGAGLPAVSVSTLAVMAQTAYRQHQLTQILPALNAHMHQIYWAAYEIQLGLAQPIIQDRVSQPADLKLPAGRWVGVGEGFQIYAAELKEWVTQTIPDLYPEAQGVLPLAKHQFEIGQTLKPDEILPVYLRDDIVQPKK